MTAPVAFLLVDDDAVRGAIRFALDVEGIGVVVVSSVHDFQDTLPAPGACLVMDEAPGSPHMLAALADLRARNFTMPAVILATTPTADFLEAARGLRARVVEKPLLCDELSTVIRWLSSGGAAK